MIVYQATYNSNIHESSPGVISIHLSKENAERVIEAHRKKEYEEWLKYDAECIKQDPIFFEQNPNEFGRHESWAVIPIEILP